MAIRAIERVNEVQGCLAFLLCSVCRCSAQRSAARRYNNLGPEGVKAVVDVAKYGLPALKELTLAWCKVGDREGAEAIAQLLQFNETLEVRHPRCLTHIVRACHSLCSFAVF